VGPDVAFAFCWEYWVNLGGWAEFPPAESRTNFVIDDDLKSEEALSQREQLAAIVAESYRLRKREERGEVLQRDDGSADER
jgi:hypothetical protein